MEEAMKWPGDDGDRRRNEETMNLSSCADVSRLLFEYFIY
jgi:hypothetical protein